MPGHHPQLPSQGSAQADHVHARAQPLSVDNGALQAGSVTTDKLASSVYAVVGTITAIDPDDAASAGTSATVARGDHQHEALTAAAVALGKDAGSSEGTSGDLARADHQHATSALGWAIMSPYQQLTANSAAYAAGATTDFALANMVVSSTRLYRVHLHSAAAASAATTWDVNFHVDGTKTLKMWTQQIAAGAGGVHINAAALWLPTSGTKNLDIRVAAGGGTLTFNAAANEPRQFWVEDIGLR